MRRLLLVASVLAGALSIGTAFAADHLDGSNLSTDPATDITDVYAWMNDEGTHLNLVMNVFPLAGATATFSDTAKYVLHVESGPDILGATTATTNVIATFDADGNVQVWVGNSAYRSGDASDTAGIGDDSVRVFTGMRNDPFFFNLGGFNDAATFVKGAQPLATDADGCPTLDEATAGEILTRLVSTADGTAAAADALAGANVLSIVIRLDIDLVNSGGDFVTVYGTTNQ